MKIHPLRFWVILIASRQSGKNSTPPQKRRKRLLVLVLLLLLLSLLTLDSCFHWLRLEFASRCQWASSSPYNCILFLLLLLLCCASCFCFRCDDQKLGEAHSTQNRWVRQNYFRPLKVHWDRMRRHRTNQKHWIIRDYLHRTCCPHGAARHCTATHSVWTDLNMMSVVAFLMTSSDCQTNCKDVMQKTILSALSYLAEPMACSSSLL